MISYPPALRRTGFVAPRAVGQFGLAIMEARAANTGRALQARPDAPPQEMRPEKPAEAAARRVVVRLWLPSTLIFLVLAPFAFLLAPFAYWATPPAYRTRPLATVLGLGRVLLSLGGTVVDVDTPEALVRIQLF